MRPASRTTAGPRGRLRESECKPGAVTSGVYSDSLSLSPPLRGAASNRPDSAISVISVLTVSASSAVKDLPVLLSSVVERPPCPLFRHKLARYETHPRGDVSFRGSRRRFVRAAAAAILGSSQRSAAALPVDARLGPASISHGEVGRRDGHRSRARRQHLRHPPLCG